MAEVVVVSGAPGAGKSTLTAPLARNAPSVVIEANFGSHGVYERQRLRALSPRAVEAYCRLPVEQAAERYAHRGTRSDHHPVLVTRSLPVSAFHEFQESMGLGPVLEVDTSTPVDVPALAKQVIANLQQALDPSA